MDWNWFFSALAQSSAAIVGLVGAFVLTKVVSNEQAFAEEGAYLRRHLREAKRLQRRAASRYFSWYNGRRRATEQSLIGDRVTADGDVVDAETRYTELNFSRYDAREEVLELINEELDYQPAPKRRGLGMISPIPDLSITTARNLQLERQVIEEREAIDQLLVDVRHSVDTITEALVLAGENRFRSKLVSDTLVGMTVLFFGGVIYPLSFLPMELGARPRLTIGAFFTILLSLRGALLVGVGVLLFLFGYRLFSINSGLVHSPTLLAELEPFSSLGSYSVYFTNYEDNIRWLEERRREEDAPPVEVE